MVSSNMQLSAIYVLLIAFFYDNTDGFKAEPNRLRYSTLKTFPVMLLAAAVHLGYGSVKGGVRRHILTAALLAGACGDFLISAFGNMELGFAMSAVVFGFGHIFYMIGFLPQLKSLSPKFTFAVTLYAVLMNYFFLLPNFQTHPITTLIMMAYSAVLAIALVVSGSLALEGTRLQAPRQKNNVLRFAGYILFFFSDSMLLLEHADLRFPCCKELAILSTYYTAQFLIMTGAVETEQFI